MTTTAKDALIRAAEILERNGWTQRPSTQMMYDRSQPRCVGLALGDAYAELGVHPLDHSTRSKTDDAITTVIGSPDYVGWNDNVCRSKDEAILMLVRAASIA